MNRFSLPLRIFISLSLLTFVCLGVWLPVQAEDSVDPANGRFITCGQNNLPVCTSAHLVEMVNKVVNFLVFQVAILLATVIIVWAGVLYVLYPYRPGNKELAKKMMKSAVGGLIIVLSAYLIVKFVVTSLVGSNADNNNSDLVEEIMGIFNEIPDTTGN